MIRTLGATACLILIFALTLASFDPRDLLLGAMLTYLVQLIFRNGLPLDQPSTKGGAKLSIPGRTLAFFPFAGITVWEILRGTVQVALIVMGIRKLEHPGIVAIPIGDRTEQGVAVTGIATTLAPGSVLLDVDWDRRVMLIHSIDASDPDQIRQDFQETYERYQRKVFP